MSKQCTCQLCIQGRCFTEHLKLIPEGQHAYFEALYEQLLQTEFDLDYYRAIVSGAWPGAVSILEQALVKARAAHAALESKL
jgi:hypothetical protein